MQSPATATANDQAAEIFLKQGYNYRKRW